jgi:hypothetical protein
LQDLISGPKPAVPHPMSRTQGAFDIVLAIGLLYLRDDQQTAPLLGAACRRLKPDARTATLGPALTAFSKVVTRSPTFFACPIRMSSWSARLEARAGLLGRSIRPLMVSGKYLTIVRRSAPLTGALSRFANSDQADFATVALLILYMLLGPYQHFPPPGWVDPAIYIGYFRDFGGLLARYGPTYFVDRWPFVLSGRLFYAALPLRFANAALVATWYAATLLAMRALLRPSVAAATRKLTLILYGCSPLVVATVTRSYADGPAIAFLLTGMAVIWRDLTSPPSHPRMFLAGSCAVLGLLTQPGSLFAWVPMLAAIVIIERHHLIAWLPTALVAGVAGSGITLIAYIAVIFWMTGTTDVFGPILAIGGKITQGLALNYREPLAAWLFPTTRLWFVAVVLAVGLWTAWSGVAVRVPAMLRQLFQCALISALGSALLMVASDVMIGTAILQVPFYASYLLPATYLLLGAVVGIWTEAAPSRRRLLPLAVAVACSTIGSGFLLALTADSAPSAAIFPVLDIACVVLAAIATVATTSTQSVAPVLVLLVVILPLSSISVDTRHVFRSGTATFGDTFQVLNQAADIIDTAAGKRDLLFWFNRDDFNATINDPSDWISPNHQVYPIRFASTRLKLNALDSLNAFYLWDRSRLNAAMPMLPPEDLAQLHRIRDPISIVMVSRSQSGLVGAHAALEAAGIPVVQRASRVIAGTAFTLDLSILDVVYLDRLPGPTELALLDRFPCAETAKWLTRWVNRPDLLQYRSDGVPRLSTLLQGLAAKPVDRCFAEAEAVLGAVDLDWRPERLPPIGANCEADLTLAGFYYDRVFDERLRQAAGSAYARSLAASQTGDSNTCLVATAVLRDMYRQAIGARVRVHLPLEERLAAVRDARLGTRPPDERRN